MSAEEGNAKGLSLEGLAQRLETLEQENAELRSEVAELKDSDPARAVEEPPASSSEKRRVSRSWLLRNAGAAAVGTMAAGALLARDASVAKADHLAPGISVDYVITHLETVNHTAVLGNAPNGEGVVGFGKANGVRGEGQAGVVGKSSAPGYSAVVGLHTGSGFGVRGSGQTGVIGVSSTPGSSGVRGLNTGSGFGVVGEGTGSNRAGVLGRNSSGYGGQFDGGQAQLKLTPKGTTGRPTSGAHTKGEIYMDSAGALFVCTADGTPGTWSKVTTTAA
jgi:hypothetical protein